MTLKEFAKVAAKSEKEGRTSKWVRRHPVASRFLLGSPIAGAVSAKKGEKIRSAAKGLGADVVGSIAGGVPSSLYLSKFTSKAMSNSKDPKVMAALAAASIGSSLAGRFGVGIPLARKWQKKHEKTGPAK